MGWTDIISVFTSFVTVSTKNTFNIAIKITILVGFEPRGPRIEPWNIQQAELLNLWRENRDRRGRSNAITDIIRQIPEME